MAVDDVASRLGLKAGMTVAHAQSLIPELTISEADPSGDVAGLCGLAAWAMRRYSPIAAPHAPDGIVIESTGCEHLFGNEEAMLTDLHARLTRRGIATRLGMANTPGGAYAVARFGSNTIEIVRNGGLEKTLRPLPIAALRLPPGVLTALFDVGFKHIGQIMDASRSSLAVRFGQVVGQKLDWALGASPELIAPYLPEGMPQHRLPFAEPIASSAGLERAVQDLARQMVDDLQQRGLGARVLNLLFERVDNAIQAIRIGLAQPSRDPHHFMRLFRERLDTIDPGFGIDAVSMTASQVEALGPQQLVSPLGTASCSDISELVDRVANLACVRRVLRLASVESDLPERSVRQLPALAPPEKCTWPAWPRPTRLFNPSEPITAIPPEAPVKFIWRGQSYRICKLDGPERIYGEWWRDSTEMTVTRDYYRIEDETGAQFWLVQTGHNWRLHGLFG